MEHWLTRDEVIGRWDGLPPFPGSVIDLIATVDDPDANFRLLAEQAALDQVLTGRILAGANGAALRMGRDAEVSDLYVAISMLGLGRVRDIVIQASLAGFFEGAMPLRMARSLRLHSVAAGVCAQELVREVGADVQVETALVAGLMHDIGRLWLMRFKPEALLAMRPRDRADPTPQEQREREVFGVDHATIGAWLAQAWDLPGEVVLAIKHHHWPDDVVASDLVPLIHVAEVVSNALDLGGAADTSVSRLSAAACQRLGLVWTENSRAMFGRISGRFAHAAVVLARQK